MRQGAAAWQVWGRIAVAWDCLGSGVLPDRGGMVNDGNKKEPLWVANP